MLSQACRDRQRHQERGQGDQPEADRVDAQREREANFVACESLRREPGTASRAEWLKSNNAMQHAVISRRQQANRQRPPRGVLLALACTANRRAEPAESRRSQIRIPSMCSLKAGIRLSSPIAAILTAENKDQQESRSPAASSGHIPATARAGWSTSAQTRSPAAQTRPSRPSRRRPCDRTIQHRPMFRSGSTIVAW